MTVAYILWNPIIEFSGESLNEIKSKMLLHCTEKWMIWTIMGKTGANTHCYPLQFLIRNFYQDSKVSLELNHCMSLMFSLSGCCYLLNRWIFSLLLCYFHGRKANRSREASQSKDEQQAQTNVSKTPKKRPLKRISKSSKQWWEESCSTYF